MADMKRKISILPLILFPVISLLLLAGNALGKFQQDEEIQKGIENNVYAEENEQCLKCHAGEIFTLSDSISGKEKKLSICDDYRINPDKFYHSAHWSFSCFDCHDEQYTVFPHDVNLRFADYWACIDCHGNDENFAQYGFEQIEIEHQNSVHFEATGGDFSCWKCHNPHTYKPLVRSGSINDAIFESNAMCLNCHGNEDKFALLSDKHLGNIVPSHSWLPNQKMHFNSVRCIECHSVVNDSIMVAHNIRPATEAVKNCVECHSQNSILMGSLYKFQAQESRRQYGFLNGAILANDAYVIGANRSRSLNLASLLLFGIVIGAIALHTVLRIIKK